MATDKFTEKLENKLNEIVDFIRATKSKYDDLEHVKNYARFLDGQALCFDNHIILLFAGVSERERYWYITVTVRKKAGSGFEYLKSFTIRLNF